MNIRAGSNLLERTLMSFTISLKNSRKLSMLWRQISKRTSWTTSKITESTLATDGESLRKALAVTRPWFSETWPRPKLAGTADTPSSKTDTVIIEHFKPLIFKFLLIIVGNWKKSICERKIYLSKGYQIKDKYSHQLLCHDLLQSNSIIMLFSVFKWRAKKNRSLCLTWTSRIVNKSKRWITRC